MATKYRIEGLDCASCAARIEDKIKEQGFDARLDFSTQSLVIEKGDLEEIKRLVSRVEPGTRVVENSVDSFPKGLLVSLVLGGIIFVLALFLDGTLHGRFEFLEYGIYVAAYLIAGRTVLTKAFLNALRGRFFDENFLMTIATLGAFAIHELPEAVAVMLFYNTGELLENIALSRSRKSIRGLVDLRAEEVNLVKDGKTESVQASRIKSGDRFIVRAGERIPIDGLITEGDTWLDLSLLTGESKPARASKGTRVLAGTINKTGLIEVLATADLEKSYTSRMLEMVEEATSRKSTTEKFITKFSMIYTPLVVFGALALAVIPPLFMGGEITEWVRRALILLVISCPCALVISVPLGYFAGIGKASRQGILVKGSNYLEALRSVDTVLFDKTGTLTRGVFEVTNVESSNGYSKEEVLKLASILERQSTHPIARSILKYSSFQADGAAVTNYSEVAGKGVFATVNGEEISFGNEAVLTENGLIPPKDSAPGSVFLVVEGEHVGTVTVSDRVKSDAKEAISLLRNQGIKEIMMLTGDDRSVAASISEELGLDSYRANLLPEDKLEVLESVMKKGKKTAFVGDGLNDSPVIARADVGIAMGNTGSDAAVETADIVLSNDSPILVSKAIETARKTHRVIIQNIGFALGIKLLFITLGTLGMVNMWGAVFADVGVALLAVLNSLRILRGRTES